MLETEIQPFVSLVSGSRQIVQLFISAHSVPLLRPGLIAPDVIGLGEKVKHNVQCEDSDKRMITPAVQRCII
jgi:hypothetical protein